MSLVRSPEWRVKQPAKWDREIAKVEKNMKFEGNYEFIKGI